jgi:hypothetical protein
MGLELERVWNYFFKKIQTNYHSFSSTLFLYFLDSMKIYNPLICVSNDTKITQFN